MQNEIEQQAIELERRLHKTALQALDIGANLVAIAALETADALPMYGAADGLTTNRRVLMLMEEGEREEAVAMLRAMWD